MSTLKQSKPFTTQHDLHRKPSLEMAALLILELIIGYEWLISGLTKII